MKPSKATAQMSTYNRNNQKQEWYDEHIYICTHSDIISEEIRDECKRRKINYEYRPFVVERRFRKRTLVESRYNICKIEVLDTGLKVQQLADWAITEYNVWLPLDPFDYNSYMVWIQPKRELNAIHYVDADFDESWEKHWRLDDEFELDDYSEKIELENTTNER